MAEDGPGMLNKDTLTLLVTDTCLARFVMPNASVSLHKTVSAPAVHAAQSVQHLVLLK